jgi:hypothetical protein
MKSIRAHKRRYFLAGVAALFIMCLNLQAWAQSSGNGADSQHAKATGTTGAQRDMHGAEDDAGHAATNAVVTGQEPVSTQTGKEVDFVKRGAQEKFVDQD